MPGPGRARAQLLDLVPGRSRSVVPAEGDGAGPGLMGAGHDCLAWPFPGLRDGNAQQPARGRAGPRRLPRWCASAWRPSTTSDAAGNRRSSAGVGIAGTRSMADGGCAAALRLVRAVRSSVVASSGQHDTGLFDTDMRDERYLPFENSGAISTWTISLPADPSAGEPTQFDYGTIADVVLHLRYTAREGGQTLRTGAMKDLRTRIDAAGAMGSHRLFSLRHDGSSQLRV